LKILICDLGNQPVALNASGVARLLLPPKLLKLPFSPSWLAGFFSLEGASVAVVDVAALFGRPPLGEQLYAHLVLLKDSLALQFPRVLEILEVDPESLSPLPPQDTFQGLAAGIIRHREQSIPLLVDSLLLTKAEKSKLEHFAELHQARVA